MFAFFKTTATPIIFGVFLHRYYRNFLQTMIRIQILASCAWIKRLNWRISKHHFIFLNRVFIQNCCKLSTLLEWTLCFSWFIRITPKNISDIVYKIINLTKVKPLRLVLRGSYNSPLLEFVWTLYLHIAYFFDRSEYFKRGAVYWRWWIVLRVHVISYM